METWQTSLMTLPLAAAAGAAREIGNQHVSPSLGKIPVAPLGWWTDFITMAIGGAGIAVGAFTDNDVVTHISTGALAAGAAYLTEDATHLGYIKYGKATPPTTLPTQVMRAQAVATVAQPVVVAHPVTVSTVHPTSPAAPAVKAQPATATRPASAATPKVGYGGYDTTFRI